MNYNIADIIKKNTSVSDYRINTTQTDSYELFFVGRALETVRSTSTTDTSVTIYAEHDGMLGDASFNVFASTTADQLAEKVAQAAEKALLVDNKAYELPKNEELAKEMSSNFTSYEPKALAAAVADAVFAADNEENSSINALEVFINKNIITVENSRGIKKSEVKYTAMVEAIPTWNEGESVELYKFFKFSEFDARAVTAEIAQSMREVAARSKAQKPNVPINCNLLLNADELQELFHEITGELSYNAVYFSQNAYKKGDNLQKGAGGDPISLTARGSIKGCTNSAFFDATGVTLVDTPLIKDGEIINYFGASRWAQYLELPVTGALPCVEVEAGTLTDDDIKKAPYIECVSMSGLQLDIYNDYIGGEVRLGYYFDGQTTMPVTGISISGKLSEVLATARLSVNRVARSSYYGPEKALFEGISVI